MNRREFLTSAGRIIVVLPAGYVWTSCKSSSSDGSAAGSGGDTSGGTGGFHGGGTSGTGTSGSSSAGRSGGTSGTGASTGGRSGGTGGTGAGTGGSNAGRGGTSGGAGGASGGAGAGGRSGAGGSSAGAGGAGAGGMGGAAGSGGGTLMFTSVGGSHTHDFTLSMSDITTPPSAGVSGNTTSAGATPHTHMVMLTKAQLDSIRMGTTVTVMTMGTSAGTAHTHTFMFHT